MVDLNNNTRRGQQSKKEAQSHRGGEGGQATRGKRKRSGVLWVEMWARGAERGQMAGKRQRGAQTNEKGQKRVSLS